jgi:hypothetical protein
MGGAQNHAAGKQHGNETGDDDSPAQEWTNHMDTPLFKSIS